MHQIQFIKRDNIFKQSNIVLRSNRNALSSNTKYLRVHSGRAHLYAALASKVTNSKVSW